LRSTARVMLGRDERGVELDYLGAVKAQRKALESVPTLRPAERAQLFESIFPGFGATVELGWQLHHRLPYRTGYERKPFRAPGHDETLIERRIEWLIFLSQTT